MSFVLTLSRCLPTGLTRSATQSNSGAESLARQRSPQRNNILHDIAILDGLFLACRWCHNSGKLMGIHRCLAHAQRGGHLATDPCTRQEGGSGKAGMLGRCHRQQEQNRTKKRTKENKGAPRKEQKRTKGHPEFKKNKGTPRIHISPTLSRVLP